MTGRWFHHNTTDATLVFVHGVLSDNEAAWLYKDKTNPEKNCSWPELIRADKNRFKDISIFLGGYYTDIDSGDAGIKDCAQELFHALAVDYDGHSPIIEWPKITFVCHSLGGIVARYMLERYADSFGTTKIGLVLIASPSYGSEYADALDWLLTQYKHKVGKELQWGSALLRDLDGRFKDVVHKKMKARLAGIEFREHHVPYYSRLPGLVKWVVYPFLPKVIVLEASAGRYFSDAVLIPGSDHNSICKPTDQDSRIHTELALFLKDSGLLPAKPDPALVQLNRQDTEQSVDALRSVSAWLSDPEARKHRDALGALRTALSETRKYIMARSSGQERISATETLLSSQWFEAAAKLRTFNPDLAFRCEVKGHGWADNSVWQSEEVSKLAISLNALLDDLIDEERKSVVSVGIANGVTTTEFVDRIIKETSAALIDQAVRRKLDIPRGKVTAQDFAAIEELDLSGTPISKLASIGRLTRLSSLNLSDCTSLFDLGQLAELKGLRFLNLRGCNRVTNLAPIAYLEKLISLNLEGCTAISDIEPTSELRELQSLDLTGCDQIEDLVPIARLDSLRYLSLKDCWKISDFGPLDHLQDLKELYLQGCALKELTPLSPLVNLTSLDLSHCAELKSLAPLWRLRQLEYLGLKACYNLEDVGAISQMPKLPMLALTGCGRLKDLRPIGSLHELRILILSHCIEIEELSPLSGLSKLGSLALNGCPSVRDLAPLIPLTELRELYIQDCPSIERIPEALAENPKLSIIR
jgi:Leucine-rich repeat (LRR) protein